jgi:RimJ/RimL family protein N-acetyltransferase
VDIAWPPRPLRWPDQPLQHGSVVLDRMTFADVPALVAAVDDQVLRWIPLPQPYTEADAVAYLTSQGAMSARGAGLTFAMRTAAGGRLVGSAGLHFRGGPGVAEVGYWVGPQDRGHGLAPAATRALATHAFAALGARRVELLIEPANVASARAAASAGACYEGVRRAGIVHWGDPRDAAVYSLLPADVGCTPPARYAW